MIPLNGTIYLRDNVWFKQENVIKLGVSRYAKDRSNTYITGEVKRGEYICVIEIPLDKMKILDFCLKNYFKSYNIYYDGGTEFYDRCIIGLIEPYLSNMNIPYKVLSKEEIDFINRCERLKNDKNIEKIIETFKQFKINSITNENSRKIKPYTYQKNILDIIENFYSENDIGKIIWACGLGKTLLSIFIVEKMLFKKVLISVPNVNLQNQIKDDILKIFSNKSNILFVGGEEIDLINSTTNKNEIINFINNIDQLPKFIISTYHSCHLLVDIKFDIKIGDEAHHLVGPQNNENKGFRLFHSIKSLKTLFMTGTEKIIESNINRKVFSMNDEYVFGKYIDIKTVYWAIENRMITDYNILILKNTKKEVIEIINNLKLVINNIELFISCYMCLKSFEKYDKLTHILLYTNTTDDSELCQKYIDEILSLNILSIKKDDFYNKALHSKNCKSLNNELDNFKKMKYGIISCVYLFGEGFNLPKLNGVCISGNMQSIIRIVQYLLRPNRLDHTNPNKKAYIIIPYIENNSIDNNIDNNIDNITDNVSYENVRHIISQMRNVDEKIEQKISILTGIIKNHKPSLKDNVDVLINYNQITLEENIDELNKIKLRLRYSKTLDSKLTEEQDEYEYVRSINISLNLQSKSDYNQKKDIHNNYIENPDQYFKLKGVWKNWYDFIGIDTTQFIQTKEEWKKICKELEIKSLDSYIDSCKKYSNLPKEPADFYNDFTNITHELNFINIRRK